MKGLLVKERKKSIGKRIRKFYLLGELCDRASDFAKDVAVGEYLKGDQHKHLLIAGEFADRLRKMTKNLRGGKVARIFKASCCDDMFVNVLSIVPKVKYMGIDVIEPEEFEMEDGSLRNRVVPAEGIGDCTDKELYDALVDDGDCTLESREVVHTGDCELLTDYRRALIGYCQVAAAVAKGLSSVAARQFVEVLRLLGEDGDDEIHVLSVDDARAALSLVKEAQGNLWTDWTLKSIRPIVLKRR